MFERPPSSRSAHGGAGLIVVADRSTTPGVAGPVEAARGGYGLERIDGPASAGVRASTPCAPATGESRRRAAARRRLARRHVASRSLIGSGTPRAVPVAVAQAGLRHGRTPPTVIDLAARDVMIAIASVVYDTGFAADEARRWSFSGAAAGRASRHGWLRDPGADPTTVTAGECPGPSTAC